MCNFWNKNPDKEKKWPDFCSYIISKMKVVFWYRRHEQFANVKYVDLFHNHRIYRETQRFSKNLCINILQIEREVILSSADKNSKIPILHDYKKRTKAAIAPDVPPKQMAAWTQAQGQAHQQQPQILSPDQVGLKCTK